jgi:hypothetical protein
VPGLRLLVDEDQPEAQPADVGYAAARAVNVRMKIDRSALEEYLRAERERPASTTPEREGSARLTNHDGANAIDPALLGTFSSMVDGAVRRSSCGTVGW